MTLESVYRIEEQELHGLFNTDLISQNRLHTNTKLRMRFFYAEFSHNCKVKLLKINNMLSNNISNVEKSSNQEVEAKIVNSEKAMFEDPKSTQSLDNTNQLNINGNEENTDKENALIVTSAANDGKTLQDNFKRFRKERNQKSKYEQNLKNKNLSSRFTKEFQDVLRQKFCRYCEEVSWDTI